jgi:hypothetical protein
MEKLGIGLGQTFSSMGLIRAVRTFATHDRSLFRCGATLLCPNNKVSFDPYNFNFFANLAGQPWLIGEQVSLFAASQKTTHWFVRNPDSLFCAGRATSPVAPVYRLPIIEFALQNILCLPNQVRRSIANLIVMERLCRSGKQFSSE